ncbi:MAG: sugar phosphate isomerase/epimerase [Ruminococcaceae bacterium]|nr:sugar phosphate isomerase/epimerase [Oscillospiraceae bacterium]
MKTAINLGFGFPELSILEQLRRIKDAGFDAIFNRWNKPGDAHTTARAADAAGLFIQSIHAPHLGTAHIWLDTAAGEAAIEELLTCLRECHEVGVTLMISHVYMGFDPEHPTELGIARYARLLDEAQKCGIRIAFENAEGEKYLAAIRDRLWEHPAAGFCIDTGHACCYDVGIDFLAKYGDKLIATHINDNEGITGTEIAAIDDAHLMPFDGAVDWEHVTKMIADTGFDDILTLELKNRNMPGRHTHDIYAHLDCAGFLNLAHARALRVAAMIESARYR